jgi:cysteinyl-tRNA synthetase
MGMKYLGEQFDIHAGGIDHIHVHHNNEIAQSQAATGKIPCVRYWLHNEFLVMDRGKMSKSSGRFLTLQMLVNEGFHPLDYRYLLLGAHYRSQLRFSWDALKGAKNARGSLMDRLRTVWDRAQAGGDEAAGGDPAKYIEAFDRAVCDDLNTPRAIAELRLLLRDTDIPARAALDAAFAMDEVLGLGLKSSLENESLQDGGASGEDDSEIAKIVDERAKAKAQKDFARADALRESLKERGIVLEDSPSGTSWRRVRP